LAVTKLPCSQTRRHPTAASNSKASASPSSTAASRSSQTARPRRPRTLPARPRAALRSPGREEAVLYNVIIVVRTAERCDGSRRCWRFPGAEIDQLAYGPDVVGIRCRRPAPIDCRPSRGRPLPARLLPSAYDRGRAARSTARSSKNGCVPDPSAQSARVPAVVVGSRLSQVHPACRWPARRAHDTPPSSA